nr:MAG TPA: hypothetical protein [Caudoviricetes sp.]
MHVAASWFYYFKNYALPLTKRLYILLSNMSPYSIYLI